MKTMCRLLCVFLSFLPISGCSEKNVDRSFITQMPCASPCWYGLELDKSSKEEVISVLQTLPFVMKDSITVSDISYMYGNDSYAIHYDCSFTVKNHRCGTLEIVNGTLKSNWYQLGYELEISEIVDLIGPPDFVQFRTPIAEIGGCDLVFFWQDLNIAVSYYHQRITKPCDFVIAHEKINPNQKIIFIDFQSDDFLLRWLNGGKTITWPGYSDSK